MPTTQLRHGPKARAWVNVGRPQMRLLAVLSHESAVFIVDWSKATQLYQIRANFKHRQPDSWVWGRSCSGGGGGGESQMKMVRGWWWYLELFDSLRALSVFRYGAWIESWNNLCKKGPWKVSSSPPLLKAGLPLKLDQVFEGLFKFWESPGMEVYFDRRGNTTKKKQA